ncbi:hypothetical protein RI196_17360 [Aeribacillus composti]|jgi:hypothetical protein|uniref:Fur-regulated basic protein A n=1 Tax=Aeribacillus composti TaxID=1868734 RepID=A0ABY9WB93_9BACI|nr:MULTISPECIES: hypothetical protein [Aeribacillus]MDR9797009.1 hypothetical protein [Aeribacillus pallidus]MED0651670.1 hypothetical protein [Aeribacillus composti]MED0704104.1 hypothetical protein [Aeribacillus composti]MED0717284.1 hypothetical protein [Aeribacillus composti]MED0746807.1 hypothetical protein [Aeribacillus composti]
MKETKKIQDEFLKILLNAYKQGETNEHVTTKELLKQLEHEIKKVYVS